MLEAFRRSRLEQGWTPEDLARKMNVSPHSLLKSESGETIPNVVFVLKWSDALGLDMGTLYTNCHRAAVGE